MFCSWRFPSIPAISIRFHSLALLLTPILNITMSAQTNTARNFELDPKQSKITSSSSSPPKNLLILDATGKIGVYIPSHLFILNPKLDFVFRWQRDQSHPQFTSREARPVSYLRGQARHLFSSRSTITRLPIHHHSRLWRFHRVNRTFRQDWCTRLGRLYRRYVLVSLPSSAQLIGKQVSLGKDEIYQRKKKPKRKHSLTLLSNTASPVSFTPHPIVEMKHPHPFRSSHPNMPSRSISNPPHPDLQANYHTLSSVQHSF